MINFYKRRYIDYQMEPDWGTYPRYTKLQHVGIEKLLLYVCENWHDY